MYIAHFMCIYAYVYIYMFVNVHYKTTSPYITARAVGS